MVDNMPASTNPEVLYEEVEDTFVKPENIKEVKSEFYATACPAYGCSINKTRPDTSINREGMEEWKFDTEICPAYESNIAYDFRSRFM